MQTTAPGRGDWARKKHGGLGDAFAFGAPAGRRKLTARPAFAAADFFGGRPSDLPPVGLAIARLAAFLGCLAIVASFGVYVAVHALVGFLGGGP
jgi:hypothetical protein